MTGFSRDINGLNVIGSPDDDFNEAIDNDLAMFSNSNFFDFDAGDLSLGQNQPQNFNSISQDAAGGVSKNQPSIDFSTDFQFPEINGLPNISGDQNFPAQESFSGAYQGSGFTSPPNGPATTSTSGTQSKRQRSDSSPQSPTDGNPDDASRAAAEEDKRRRNTAASARFRVKKKQREQAMEKKATDMEKKVDDLETQVRELQRDNTLLKNLLTERGDKYDLEDLRTKTESVKKETQ